MPSRIDIGPEGGPFVAINENSNDLELQDINGNVIAKWDETAGQWDLNNNSLTGINAIDASSANVESVSTESASVNGSLDAETATVEQADIGNATVLRSSDGWETIEGTDPDDRLDNALAAASDGDVIYLEPVDYAENRTGDDAIGTQVNLFGTFAGSPSGTDLDADWEIQNSITIRDISMGSSQIDINSNFCRIENVRIFTSSGEIRISDGVQSVLTSIVNDGSVIFESGTSENIIDSSADISVTDNGSNTVGDIA